jgi:hypothetical protein
MLTVLLRFIKGLIKVTGLESSLLLQVDSVQPKTLSDWSDGQSTQNNLGAGAGVSTL